MASMRICLLIAVVVWTNGSTMTSVCAAREVVAFWGFADEYDFDTNPNKQDFAAEVDTTVSGDANLEAFLGVADALDNNGGGGFVSYTSPVSGATYGPTRTLKFDDLKGGGDDFDIDGLSTFTVDKNDGAGSIAGEDFGNDALVYITLDGTGFADFQIRFDIEGTPGDLPSTFDIFYRVDGLSGTWYREADQNNIGLTFVDYDPVDPENMYANSGVIDLSSLLDNAASIEIILNDFAENGNGEMELDNIEITATPLMVPEPGTVALLITGMLACTGARLRWTGGQAP